MLLVFLNDLTHPYLMSSINRHDVLRTLLRVIFPPLIDGIFTCLSTLRTLICPIIQMTRPLMIHRYLICTRL